MSDLSLRGYISTALRKDAGEVRLAKGTTDQLVNKGTLGNRIASFFQDGARAIGLMRPDPTRAQRQQSALDGFKDALEGHFGKEAADAALHATGLDGHGAVLTGRAILAAANHAKAAVGQNRSTHEAGIQAFMPPGPGEEAEPGFARLAASMKPPLDPADLDATQRLEFAERLRENVAAESQGHRQPLDDEAIKGIAKDTLKQVLKLSNAEGLEGPAAARERFVGAMKDVIKGLATGKDAGALATRLNTAVARFGEHAAAERMDEVGGGEFQELTEKATRRAMAELRAEDPGLLKKAQANALKDGSPLRALYAAAYDSVVKQQGSPERQEAAGRLFSTAVSVVSSLGGALPPVTGSVGEDVNRLADDSTVPAKALQAARQALQATFHGL